MRAALIPGYFMASSTTGAAFLAEDDATPNLGVQTMIHRLFAFQCNVNRVRESCGDDWIEKWTVDVYARIELNTVGGPGRVM